eukprot:PhF_6_TR40408/c2_g1_i5/m.60221
MTSAERIDKFFDDITPHLSTSTTWPKLRPECDKLSTWIFKHQDESIPEGAKQKLFTIIQSLYKVASNTSPPPTPLTLESIHKVLETYLQVPEGKLVSSKAKQSVLKWLEALRGMAASQPGGSAIPVVPTKRYLITDVSQNTKTKTTTVSVVDLETNEDIEDLVFEGNEVLRGEILKHFLELDSVEMEVQGTRVIAVYGPDNNELE